MTPFIPTESNDDTGLTMEMADLIIAEVRQVGSKQDALADKQDELAEKVDAYMLSTDKRLTVVETQLHPIIGNGQPGLCAQRLVYVNGLHADHEKRISKLENWRFWVLGIAAATTTLAGVIAWYLEHAS